MLRNWIITTFSKRMTAQYPSACQPSTLTCTIPFYRLQGILGAGRHINTVSPYLQWRQIFLINLYQTNQYFCYHKLTSIPLCYAVRTGACTHPPIHDNLNLWPPAWQPPRCLTLSEFCVCSIEKFPGSFCKSDALQYCSQPSYSPRSQYGFPASRTDPHTSPATDWHKIFHSHKPAENHCSS